MDYYEHRRPCDPTVLVRFRQLLGKRQRTILGRLARQIQTKVTTLNAAIRETLGKANRMFAQTANRKTETPKLYSWHAPEVVCMSKGKARTPYEFGSKVGIATTLRGSLIVGARAFEGNPYDGHTLAEQIEQVTILMHGTGMKPGTAWVDLGYRGVDAENPDIEIKHRGGGKKARLTELEVKTLKRRQAIEPVIGHLKGALGDKLHAVLCAAGYNIRWLLRMISKKRPAGLSARASG
jgi:IS5 family transposase